MPRIILFASLLSILCGDLPAQLSAPHPELNWSSIETQHFVVHFHDGTRRTAQEVAHIGEAVFGPITTMYGYVPDSRIHFVVRDHDDYSNGAAYFFDNKIEIWAPALDFDLRGTHPWLWNVVTHEFTHIIQIQTSLKFGRRFPAFYLQWLGYETERRPDVLYGYPNVLVSYPISGFVVPSWFAEGTAQYNHPSLEFDYWDTHRDMILRMYMLEGTPLSWEEMAVFGKTSLGNESAYNAGFSLVQYISERYGLESLRRISERLGAPFRVTIDGAVKEVLGISGEQLYDEWKRVQTERYRAMEKSVAPARCEGRLIERDGFGNGMPAFSPDGSHLAYVSNKGQDYFGVSSVYLRDLKTGETNQITPMVRSPLSFSPDGSSLFYAKITPLNRFWSQWSDLYRYDLKTEEETRLTHGLRLASPALSADGKMLAAAVDSDGTVNLAALAADGSHFRRITQFNSGEQVHTPVWSPDGSFLAFGYSKGHGQSIAFIDSNGTNLRFLALPGDARNPAFSPDGRSLYFSWDTTGIFNLYRMDRANGRIVQVTNVLGGAFSPAVSAQGMVAYTAYRADGFKIALLDPDSAFGQSAGTAAFAATPRPDGSPAPAPDTLTIRPYRSAFTSLSLIPVLRFDNYNEHGTFFDRIKPGLYVSSGEMLEKMSLFAGASINRQLERDVFLSFEYRDRIPGFYHLGLSPTLLLELYSLSRKTEATFPIFLSTEQTVRTDVTYDLFELDLSLTERIFTDASTLRLMYTKSRYSASIGFFSLLDPVRGDVIQSQAFRTTYLINDILSARWRVDAVAPTVDREINPIGRTISLRYSRELNRYNRDLEYDYSKGMAVPVYRNVNFHRIELAWNEHLQLFNTRHTLTLGIHGGTIQGMTADTIFHFYAGGFIGMKGYPFYAIEGNHLATFNLTYRFPLWTTINTRVFQMYFTKLYGSVFADLGNAWNGSVPSLNSWRTDAGIELRLEAFSFYAFPTRIFLAGAYGFDQFERSFRGADVTYGREWRFYLGVLFGFELTDVVPTFLGR